MTAGPLPPSLSAPRVPIAALVASVLEPVAPSVEPLTVIAEPLALVALAGVLASGLLVSLALAASARRRSPSYFLVTLALATLLARSLLGVVVVVGGLDHPRHHLLEHGLDVVGVLLLFGAVYAARTADPGEGARD